MDSEMPICQPIYTIKAISLTITMATQKIEKNDRIMFLVEISRMAREKMRAMNTPCLAD
jgi:hypothetical protein